MSTPIEDLRFSSSAIDDFFKPRQTIKVASIGKVRISGVNQLEGFQILADNKLVRLSQQDFWKLGQDSEGHFIERLVDDSSNPIQG